MEEKQERSVYWYGYVWYGKIGDTLKELSDPLPSVNLQPIIIQPYSPFWARLSQPSKKSIFSHDWKNVKNDEHFWYLPVVRYRTRSRLFGPGYIHFFKDSRGG